MAKILIIDDHVLNREFLQSLLRYDGHDPMQAASGAQALALLADQPGQAGTDLIICDILMPQMDGYAFVRALRRDALLRHIPVIFYSAALSERASDESARQAGVSAILPKPSDPDLILATVRAALPAAQPAGLQQAPLTRAHESAAGGRERKLLGDLEAIQDSSRKVAHIAQNAGPDSAHNTGLGQNLTQALSTLQNLSLRLTELIESGIDMASQQDPGQLTEIACHAAHKVCNAQITVIGLFDPVLQRPAMRLSHSASRGLPPAVAAALATGALGAGAIEQLCSQK
jgi:CheY-like chemotaxis protein